MPYLSPMKFLPFLVENAPEVLFGGLDVVQGQKLLSSFWAAYEMTHPTHDVYQHHRDNLGTTLPMCLHGDEGRGVRKGNTCLMSLESIFGVSTVSNLEQNLHYGDCKCCSAEGLDMNLDVLSNSCRAVPIAQYMDHNIKGHCYLTKHLISVLPHALYKDTNLLMEMVEHISLELRQLFYEGFYARKQYWNVAVLGWKGDLAWFVKIGRLTRAYNRLAETACMCHECGAGTSQQPFEDLNEAPSWRASMYFQRPWDAENPPAFRAVPFDTFCPERILRRDVFHNSKLGVYRDFVASSVLLLCELRFFHDPPGPGVRNGRQHLLKRAHGRFRLFCLASQRPAALHSFTKDNFNAPKRKAFPWMSCKGSDCTLLMQWIVVLTRGFLMIMDPECEQRELLELIYQAARAGDQWMRCLYKHGIWLSRTCATALLREQRCFLETYNSLAQRSLQMGHCFYGMKPKIHMLAHTAWETKCLLGLEDLELIPNPMLWCCEPNEDMVGRISRISRRVHQKTVCMSTIQKYLVKCRALYRRMKNPAAYPPTRRKRKRALK